MKILLIIVIILLLAIIGIAFLAWRKIKKARNKIIEKGAELLVDTSLKAGKILSVKFGAKLNTDGEKQRSFTNNPY